MEKTTLLLIDDSKRHYSKKSLREKKEQMIMIKIRIQINNFLSQEHKVENPETGVWNFWVPEFVLIYFVLKKKSRNY